MEMVDWWGEVAPASEAMRPTARPDAKRTVASARRAKRVDMAKG
jgi:hypothetical protein